MSHAKLTSYRTDALITGALARKRRSALRKRWSALPEEMKRVTEELKHVHNTTNRVAECMKHVPEEMKRVPEGIKHTAELFKARSGTDEALSVTNLARYPEEPNQENKVVGARAASWNEAIIAESKSNLKLLPILLRWIDIHGTLYGWILTSYR